MSDEQQRQDPGNAPTDDGGDGGDATGDNMEVVLTKKQVDELFVRAKNSAAAEMRRAGEFKRQQQPQPSDDPRVARGLELLKAYEQAESQYERDVRAHKKRFAAHPEWDPSGREPPKPEILKLGAPTQQRGAQPQSEIGQLVELMKMDIASRMADKLPRVAPTYPTAGQQVNAEISERLAAIDPDDPQHSAKLQRSVLDGLKNVKIAAPGNPALRDQLTKKKG